MHKMFLGASPDQKLCWGRNFRGLATLFFSLMIQSVKCQQWWLPTGDRAKKRELFPEPHHVSETAATIFV